MTPEESKAVVLEYLERALAGGDEVALERLAGNDHVKQRVRASWPATADRLLYPPAVIFAGEGYVGVNFRMRARHVGPVRSLQPTGETRDLRCTAIYKVEGGRVVDLWATWDFLALAEPA